jgi:hypothetical protein
MSECEQCKNQGLPEKPIVHAATQHKTAAGLSPMNTPPSPSEHAMLAAQLAQELASLRDALVALSLSLRDWQFEQDVEARKAVQQQLDQTLARLRAKQAPCDKPD